LTRSSLIAGKRPDRYIINSIYQPVTAQNTNNKHQKDRCDIHYTLSMNIHWLVRQTHHVSQDE